MAALALGLAAGALVGLVLFVFWIREEIEYLDDRLNRYFDMLTHATRQRCREGGRVSEDLEGGGDVLVTLQQNDVRNTSEQVVARAANLAKFAEAALAFAEHPRASSEARRLE